MKIISANYRDRRSQFKWLVRDEYESIDQAVPCMAVRAKNVEFIRSSEEERGFGCSIVARASDAEVIVETKKKSRIRKLFESLQFYHDRFETKRRDWAGRIGVKGAKELDLHPDGSVYAKCIKPY